MGADMWEVDVRLTQDAVCVVCHDDNLFRLTGKNLVLSKSPWSRIQRLPLIKGGTIPSFKEVVELACDMNVGIYAEIKGEDAGLSVWSELRRQGLDFAVIGSFRPQDLLQLHKARCEYPLSVLVPTGEDPFFLAQTSGADIIHPSWENARDKPQELITPELLSRTRESGFEMVLWHEERPEVLRDLLGLPVLGICSDKPELLTPFPSNPDILNRPQIVCHRGAESFAPENTLSAVDLAFDQEFDIVEIDVRQTRDGVPIVMHDRSANRTTNGRGAVKKMNYSEVSKLDAGSWFDPFFAGEPVPRLEDVLDRVKGRGGVYIEIKEAEAKAVLDLVLNFEMLEDCFFWCEDLLTMDKLRKLNADVRLMARRYDFPDLETAIKRHQPQVIEFNGLKFTQTELEECREAGIMSMPFHMSSSKRVIKKLAEAGTDMLNLGRPELLKNLLIEEGRFP